jgi:ParB/RepB/Spo0J family partition protein
LQVKLTDIHYDDKFNTRGFFSDQSVLELSASIKSAGLIQPLILRPQEGEKPYHFVCGHRRFKAIELLAWAHVEAHVRRMTDREAILCNLQENLARVNLSPSQELAAILVVYGAEPSVAQVAKELGRSKKWVNERLAIRKLRPKIRGYVDKGLLTPWDISMLLPCPANEQDILATKLVQAHNKGKSSSSVFDKVGKGRRVRSKAAIQAMLTELMDAGLEPPGWRCLAWAAGTLTDKELKDAKRQTNG